MIDASCVFCSKEETLHHLLFDCHITNQIWSKVLHHIGYNRKPEGWDQKRLWLIAETMKKGWHRDMLKIAIAESVYGIWRYRNDVIFKNAYVDPQIWKMIIQDIIVRSSLHKSNRNHVNIESMSISP